MPTFTHFFQIQALKDRLPFGIDFDIKPITGDTTQQVGRFQFPVLNELTAREAWFFESLEVLNGEKTSELKLLIRNLGKQLKSTCKLKSLREGIDNLFEASEELLNSPEYESFLEANEQEIDSLVELCRIVQGENSVGWLRVTFFILSRSTGNWTLGDTVSMTNSEIKEILDFISLEANRGVVPASEPQEEEKEGGEEKK